jgi:hypothetical protein
MADTRSAETLVSSIKALVGSKKNAAREIVEELRALSLHPPVPGLFDTLLAALHSLKANKKAGEENKVLRATYQYLAQLAGVGGLAPDEAVTLMHQLLRVDARDELVPRQLAALQLLGELARSFPDAERTWARWWRQRGCMPRWHTRTQAAALAECP